MPSILASKEISIRIPVRERGVDPYPKYQTPVWKCWDCNRIMHNIYCICPICKEPRSDLRPFRKCPVCKRELVKPRCRTCNSENIKELPQEF